MLAALLQLCLVGLVLSAQAPHRVTSIRSARFKPKHNNVGHHHQVGLAVVGTRIERPHPPLPPERVFWNAKVVAVTRELPALKDRISAGGFLACCGLIRDDGAGDDRCTKIFAVIRAAYDRGVFSQGCKMGLWAGGWMVAGQAHREDFEYRVAMLGEREKEHKFATMNEGPFFKLLNDDPAVDDRFCPNSMQDNGLWCAASEAYVDSFFDGDGCAQLQYGRLLRRRRVQKVTVGIVLGTRLERIRDTIWYRCEVPRLIAHAEKIEKIELELVPEYMYPPDRPMGFHFETAPEIIELLRGHPMAPAGPDAAWQSLLGDIDPEEDVAMVVPRDYRPLRRPNSVMAAVRDPVRDPDNGAADEDTDEVDAEVAAVNRHLAVASSS